MDIAHLQSHSSLPHADEMRRKLSALNKIPDGVGMCPDERQAIQEAAEAFESYFIQIMLREMRNTLSDDDGLIPRSTAERIFTEMLDEEIAKEAARGGGIGLAQVIVQQMTRDSYTANMR